MDQLLYNIEEELSNLIATVDVHLPMKRMDLVSLAHKEGDVVLEEYTSEGIHLVAHLPRHLEGVFTQGVSE